MHRIAALIILLLPALIISAQPADSSVSDDAVRLRQIEKEWNQALERGDRSYVEALLAPEAVFTTGRGRLVMRAEVLDAMKGEKIEISTVSDLDIRVYGDSAVILGSYYQKGSGGAAAYESRGRFTDVFVKRDGRWQVVAVHTSPLPN